MLALTTASMVTEGAFHGFPTHVDATDSLGHGPDCRGNSAGEPHWVRFVRRAAAPFHAEAHPRRASNRGAVTLALDRLASSGIPRPTARAVSSHVRRLISRVIIPSRWAHGQAIRPTVAGRSASATSRPSTGSPTSTAVACRRSRSPSCPDRHPGVLDHAAGGSPYDGRFRQTPSTDLPTHVADDRVDRGGRAGP